jgi:hypothetical protein
VVQGAVGMPGVNEAAKLLTGPPAPTGGMLTAVSTVMGTLSLSLSLCLRLRVCIYGILCVYVCIVSKLSAKPSQNLN